MLAGARNVDSHLWSVCDQKRELTLVDGTVTSPSLLSANTAWCRDGSSWRSV